MVPSQTEAAMNSNKANRTLYPGFVMSVATIMSPCFIVEKGGN